MKVYVDEKDDDVYPDEIDMKGKLSIWFEESEYELEHDIELHLLTDHDKEVRKQVCDEIRCKLMEDDYSELRDYQGIKYAWFNLPAFSEILDQIEKGDKE